ncbi:MAG: polysaccharide deacetylase family protein [Planctomycetales bacterium]|nr:polysaccharide deacetylase family protein [Planctomycetales bacterium]
MSSVYSRDNTRYYLLEIERYLIMQLDRFGIAAYYLATLPLRRLAIRRAERQGLAPILVLFYHRVADTHPNGWTISRDGFAEQLEWLRQHVELISLAEAHRRIAVGRNSKLAACITFDDGYADNCDFALPLLLSSGVPCTYFVTTQNSLEQKPFAHDVLAGTPVLPNTREQIVELARDGIEIGAHTRTHCDLGRIKGSAELYDEIAGSGDDLADWLARPIRFFAFPFGLPGNLSPSALHVAQQAGYQAVCTAYGGYNLPGQNAFQILRFHADPDMWRFKNWMSVDPRKYRLHRPLDWSPEPNAPSMLEV